MGVGGLGVYKKNRLPTTNDKNSATPYPPPPPHCRSATKYIEIILYRCRAYWYVQTFRYAFRHTPCIPMPYIQCKYIDDTTSARIACITVQTQPFDSPIPLHRCTAIMGPLYCLSVTLLSACILTFIPVVCCRQIGPLLEQRILNRGY